MKGKPSIKVANVPVKDQFNYVEFAREHNENLLKIDEGFSKIKPINRKLIVKCLMSPNPVQMEMRSNEATNAVVRKLHPEPLFSIGVVVAADEVLDIKVGDIIQFPINYVMSQESLNVPNKYYAPFFDNYGYVIIDSHAVQCKLTELPVFDYPTINLTETND